ncbi:MAG: hypothetical protein U9Q69_05025, partial [Nanoarchaeota archaeon]|nr:hypothetical protein [Nanoarchaeota archaeon]
MKKWLPMSRRDFFKLSLAGISSLAMASCTGRFILKTLNSAVNYDKYSSNQNISQINLAYLNAADFRGRTMNIFETITPEMALFRIKQLAKFFIEEKIDIFCGGEFDSYDTYKTGCLNQSLELAKFMGSPYNYVLMDEYMKSPLWTTGNCIISKFPLKRRKRHIFGGRMLDKRLKHMYKDFIHITSKVGRRELEMINNYFKLSS